MTQSVYNVVLGETAEGSLMNLLSKEEQRYGRNKETVINRSYIESGEYRKKFDRISDNAELNKLLYQLAKKMLLHRSGTLYEDMYWIDPDTLEVVASETNCELEQQIVYSEATKRAIRGKKGLITIHSHPNSFPPSVEDFNSNFGHENLKGIVCGHDGSIYVYEANEMIRKESGGFLHQKYFNLYRDEKKAQIEMWKQIASKSKIIMEEVV